MKKASNEKEIIKGELAYIMKNMTIQNKLLQKIIDKLEKPLSSASNESQHQKL